jgi:hypothetical protein
MSLTKTPGNPQVDALRNRAAVIGAGGVGSGSGPIVLYSSAGAASVNFTRVQDAIDYAVAHSITNFAIQVAPGSYPDPIVIPQNVICTIQGFVSGQAALGNLTWQTSGGLLQSGLLLRNVSVPDVTIVDGSSPASLAIMVFENVTVSPIFFSGTGDITQTGTSTIQAQLSGISSAETSLSGVVVSSLVAGAVTTAGAFNLGVENTAFSGPVSASLLFAAGSQFDGNITIRGAEAELVSSRVGAITIEFSGAPGTLKLDTVPHYWFITNGATLVNGSIVSLGAVVINQTVEATVGTITAGGLATISLPVTGVQNARAVVVTAPQSFTDANVGLFLPTIAPGVVQALALNFTGSDFTPGDPVPFQVAVTY